MLVGAVRQLPALRRLVDGVALADLLLGFAEVAAEGQGGGGPLGRCTRPQLQREGPLAIVQVRRHRTHLPCCRAYQGTRT